MSTRSTQRHQHSSTRADMTRPTTTSTNTVRSLGHGFPALGAAGRLATAAPQLHSLRLGRRPPPPDSQQDYFPLCPVQVPGFASPILLVFRSSCLGLARLKLAVIALTTFPCAHLGRLSLGLAACWGPKLSTRPPSKPPAMTTASTLASHGTCTARG